MPYNIPSNQESGAKEYAEQMMIFIEKWLGNPATRTLLKFATKTCKKCGNRVDLVAKIYAGKKKPKMCFSCKATVFGVKRIFDYIFKRVKLEQKDVDAALQEPM